MDPALLNAYHFPAIALVQSYFSKLGGLNAQGSAVLIGGRVLLTAGHNIFDYGSMTQAIDVRFAVNPLRTFRSNTFETTTQWRDQDSYSTNRWLSAFDYGVIVLAESVVDLVTPLEVQTAQGFDLQTTPVFTAGYPAEPEAFRGSLFGAQALPFFPPEYASLSNSRLFYPIRTLDGMSGGPVCTTDSAGTLRVRAIHTSSSYAKDLGSAALISAGADGLIRHWLNKYAVG